MSAKRRQNVWQVYGTLSGLCGLGSGFGGVVGKVNGGGLVGAVTKADVCKEPEGVVDQNDAVSLRPSGIFVTYSLAG